MAEPSNTAAHTGDEAASERSRRRRSTVRTAVQLFGFGVGVILLVWCVRKVLGEENRAALERLRDASAWQIVLLLALSAMSIILNGLIFWVVIRPVHKVRLPDMIATNGVGTFLGYLPFKVSVIARWLIHNRRDGVPNLTIGTWFMVVVGLMLVTVTPLGLAFLRPEGAGWWWWAVVLAGVAALHAIAMVAARWMRGDVGLRRLRAARVPGRILDHHWFHRLHDAAAMAGDGHTALVAAAARVADIGGFTLRIWIATRILGVQLSVEDTALIGLAYFVIGVVSPFGTVGTREGGALALAVGAGVMAAKAQQDALLTAILLVTVTDAMTSFIGAGFGLAWLRADRLLPGRGGLGSGPDIEPVSEPAMEPATEPITEPPTQPTAHVPDEANDTAPTSPDPIELHPSDRPAAGADDPTIPGEDRPGPAEPDRR